MTKEKLTVEQFLNLELPNIILYAAPVMIILVGLEWYFSFRERKDYQPLGSPVWHLSANRRPAQYGITTPVNSYNPVYLCFHEWVDIVKDVRKSNSVKEAYMMVFVRASKLEDEKKLFRNAS